jgi:hypothetical protein
MDVSRRELPGLLLVAATVVALATVGAAWRPTAPISEDLPAFGPVRALTHWDSGWYAAIARDGYFYRPGQQSSIAFFPLYPLAISSLMRVGVNRWVAAVCLSLVFGVAAVLLFSRWARRVREAHASTAVWLLMLYPFSVYLYGIAYSDGLFLLCAVAAFLSLEEDHPQLAAVFGALATLSRPVAPAIIVGLLVRSVERRRARGLEVRWVDLVPGLAGLGLLAWMLYLEARFGDALAFVHVQTAPGWNDVTDWERWLKFTWFREVLPSSSPLVVLRLGGHALAALVGLALVVPTWRRLGHGYGVYVLLAVGLPLVSSKDFQGLGRYLLAAFPLFLTAASLVHGSTRGRRAILVAFGGLLAFCAVAFGAGGYVA